MARSDHGFVEGELAGGKKLAALETDSEFNIKGKWQDVGGLLGSPKRVYCSFMMFGFWDRMKTHRALRLHVHHSNVGFLRLAF